MRKIKKVKKKKNANKEIDLLSYDENQMYTLDDGRIINGSQIEAGMRIKLSDGTLFIVGNGERLTPEKINKKKLTECVKENKNQIFTLENGKEIKLSEIRPNMRIKMPDGNIFTVGKTESLTPEEMEKIKKQEESEAPPEFVSANPDHIYTLENGTQIKDSSIKTGMRLKLPNGKIFPVGDIERITDENIDEIKAQLQDKLIYQPIEQYINAGDLKPGMKIKTSDGKSVTIEKIQEITYDKPITVYNIEVESNHNYFVGNDKILVHNKEISLRKLIDTKGLRNDKPLTQEQKEELLEYAELLGFNKEYIQFLDFDSTSETGLLFDQILMINNDVLPTENTTRNPNSLISGKGTLAHEIVGHYETTQKKTSFLQSEIIDGQIVPIPENIALDEAQASIRAARFAPDLTDSDRILLIKDAIQRLKKENKTLKDVKHLLDILER